MQIAVGFVGCWLNHKRSITRNPDLTKALFGQLIIQQNPNEEVYK